MAMTMTDAVRRMSANPERNWSNASADYQRSMGAGYESLQRCIKNRRREGVKIVTTHDIARVFGVVESADGHSLILRA